MTGHSPTRAVLGADFSNLPAQVQAFHGGSGTRRWVGTAEIRRGRGWAAGMVAALFGFPRAGSAVPTTVTITSEGRTEIWTRDFGGQILRSRQWSAPSRAGPLLLFERFGPVSVGSLLVQDGDRLRIVPRTGALFGLPLPARFLPSGEAFETVREGRFGFDVSIRLPLVGLVVAYLGQLAIAGDEADGG